MENMDPLELVQQQYLLLKNELRSTKDARERKIISKRISNLVSVMQFLVSVSKNA